MIIVHSHLLAEDVRIKLLACMHNGQYFFYEFVCNLLQHCLRNVRNRFKLVASLTRHSVAL